MGPGSLLRGAGAGVAVLLPGRPARVGVLVASYAVGWFVDPKGFQVLSLTGKEDAGPVLRVGPPLLTATASWTGAQLGLGALVRRTPVPSPVAALGYALLVAWADSVVGAAAQLPTAASSAA
jgi:hypothetical protein